MIMMYLIIVWVIMTSLQEVLGEPSAVKGWRFVIFVARIRRIILSLFHLHLREFESERLSSPHLLFKWVQRISLDSFSNVNHF